MILELDNSFLIASHNYQQLDLKKKLVSIVKKFLKLTSQGFTQGQPTCPSHSGLISFISKPIKKKPGLDQVLDQRATRMTH